MAAPNVVALIMAGGSGTRFWPLSNGEYPKQFLKLTGEKSLLSVTMDRIAPVVGKENVWVCALASQKALFQKEVPEFKNLILEPQAKNTGPCLMLSAYSLLKQGFSEDAVMIVLAADHHIEKVETFQKLLLSAVALAREKECLVTLGIIPTHPHTGYGYIEADMSTRPVRVKRFVEKPDQKRAEEFLRAKNFYWNSGMFVWRLGSIVKAFEKFCSSDWKALNSQGPEKAYPHLTSQPIDKAVMERADNIYLLPTEIGWSDIGSWGALYELRTEKEGANVVLSGNAKVIQSEGCLVHLPAGKSVALVGVKDLVVVEKDGHLLIVQKEKDQLVREAAKAFETTPRRG